LQRHYDENIELHKICCHHEPEIDKGSVIVNICAGCHRRFSTLYEGISTVSLWEVLNKLDAFDYPDYKGLHVSIHDPCPIRDKPQVHKAVRSLLKKMNIEIEETAHHSGKSICCGDSFYPSLSLEKVHKKMKERADSMPCRDVVVYCVSCIKSLYIGGKKPRHIGDLLLGEETFPQVYDTEAWHTQLKEYTEEH
jgi:Fe-S oxidoreductase